MLYHLNIFSSHVEISLDRLSKPQNTSVIQKSMALSKRMQMRPNRATLTEKPHPPTKMGYACRIFQPISLKHVLHFLLLKITL